MGTNAESFLDYYPCLDNMWALDSGEIVFAIDTSNSPYDTLAVNIDATAPVFVYSGCDTDSLTTYCVRGTACIENVVRGEQFIVIMEGPQGSQTSWDFSVSCHEYHLMGETCEDAIELTGPVSNMGVCTAGHRDDYSMMMPCGLNVPGGDIIYKLCLAPYSQFHGTLTTECIEYIAFYLFTDCNDPENSCIAAAGDHTPDTLPDMIEIYFNNGALPLEVYLAIDNTCDTPQSDGFGGLMSLSVEFDPCPPPEVCCFPDGSCMTVFMPDECYQAGGDIYPQFFSCDPNPCPPPPLVCCLPDGFCQIVEVEEECYGIGGTLHPDLFTCEPNPCPQPEAVCCFEEECQILHGAQCFQLGGLWYPEWDSCDPNPCASSSVDELPSATRTQLLPAEPNPFSGATMIHYHLAQAGKLRIELYDPTGRVIRHLYSGSSEAGRGSLNWDGCNDLGQPVGPGAYFVRLHTLDLTKSWRVVKLQ